MLPFAACLKADIPDDQEAVNMVELTYGSQFFTFCFASREEQKYWLDTAFQDVENHDNDSADSEDSVSDSENKKKGRRKSAQPYHDGEM